MSVFSDKGGTNANGPQRSYVQQPNGNMLTGYQGGASFGSPGMSNMLTGFGGAQQSPGISGLYGSMQQTPSAPAVMPPPNPEISGLPVEQMPTQPYEPRTNPELSGLPVQPMPSGNGLSGLPFMPSNPQPAKPAPLTSPLGGNLAQQEFGMGMQGPFNPAFGGDALGASAQPVRRQQKRLPFQNGGFG